MPDSNPDLRPSAKNPGPLDADRVWTICELIALRSRDSLLNPSAKSGAGWVAEEIRAVRKAWENWK